MHVRLSSNKNVELKMSFDSNEYRFKKVLELAREELSEVAKEGPEELYKYLLPDTCLEVGIPSKLNRKMVDYVGEQIGRMFLQTFCKDEDKTADEEKQIDEQDVQAGVIKDKKKRKQDIIPRRIDDNSIKYLKQKQPQQTQIKRCNVRKQSTPRKLNAKMRNEKRPKMYTLDVTKHPDARNAISAKAYRMRRKEENADIFNKMKRMEGLMQNVEAHLNNKKEMTIDDLNSFKNFAI